jgi:ATP-binding cassette subfamily C (CFTR/MRP) protein 4
MDLPIFQFNWPLRKITFLCISTTYFQNCRLLIPLYIKRLLDYYTPNQTEVTRQQAYIFASVLVLLSLIRVLFAHWYLFQLHILGIKVRIACSALIYRRCLKLKKSTLEKISVGRLVNLLSNDVSRFDTALINVHALWMVPVELIVAIYYMDVTLGHTAIAGAVVLILTLFFQG